MTRAATAAILDTNHGVLLCGDRVRRAASAELAHRDEGQLVEFAARILGIFGSFCVILEAVELLLRCSRRYKNTATTIGLPKRARGLLGSLVLATFTAFI